LSSFSRLEAADGTSALEIKEEDGQAFDDRKMILRFVDPDIGLLLLAPVRDKAVGYRAWRCRSRQRRRRCACEYE
jgi:hypothetical protein